MKTILLIVLLFVTPARASFQKEKMTRFGVVGNYSTIVDVRMNFQIQPIPVLDEQGSVVGVKGGTKSTITLATFKDRAAYVARSTPLEVKVYEVDFMTALGVARSTQKTCERAAYDLIKTIDSFYADALDVE